MDVVSQLERERERERERESRISRLWACGGSKERYGSNITAGKKRR
jgi:hypothetical protein